jgi:DNA-binding response OmpR family regulator
MKRTKKARAQEASQKPVLGMEDDPAIAAIVADILQHEEPKVKRVRGRLGEPEVLRRAHPSLILLDTPHQFI